MSISSSAFFGRAVHAIRTWHGGSMVSVWLAARRPLPRARQKVEEKRSYFAVLGTYSISSQGRASPMPLGTQRVGPEDRPRSLSSPLDLRTWEVGMVFMEAVGVATSIAPSECSEVRKSEDADSCLRRNIYAAPAQRSLSERVDYRKFKFQTLDCWAMASAWIDGAAGILGPALATWPVYTRRMGSTGKATIALPEPGFGGFLPVDRDGDGIRCGLRLRCSHASLHTHRSCETLLQVPVPKKLLAGLLVPNSDPIPSFYAHPPHLRRDEACRCAARALHKNALDPLHPTAAMRWSKRKKQEKRNLVPEAAHLARASILQVTAWSTSRLASGLPQLPQGSSASSPLRSSGRRYFEGERATFPAIAAHSSRSAHIISPREMCAKPCAATYTYSLTWQTQPSQPARPCGFYFPDVLMLYGAASASVNPFGVGASSLSPSPHVPGIQPLVSTKALHLLRDERGAASFPGELPRHLGPFLNSHQAILIQRTLDVGTTGRRWYCRLVSSDTTRLPGRPRSCHACQTMAAAALAPLDLAMAHRPPPTSTDLHLPAPGPTARWGARCGWLAGAHWAVLCMRFEPCESSESRVSNAHQSTDQQDDVGMKHDESLLLRPPMLETDDGLCGTQVAGYCK
ncbi:hypothetical protein G7046_g921 [Stylonectria norvegica]|nr:hypothetical protein G7046_g921 [Stylonectria norvegica]